MRGFISGGAEKQRNQERDCENVSLRFKRQSDTERDQIQISGIPKNKQMSGDGKASFAFSVYEL